jgi:hypothetical protein
MARRQPHPPPPVMPAELRCFDAADWPDRDATDDEAVMRSDTHWWAMSEHNRSYARWHRARMAWYRSNGYNALEALRADYDDQYRRAR